MRFARWSRAKALGLETCMTLGMLTESLIRPAKPDGSRGDLSRPPGYWLFARVRLTGAGVSALRPRPIVFASADRLAA